MVLLGTPLRFHPPSLGPEAPIGQALPVLPCPAAPGARPSGGRGGTIPGWAPCARIGRMELTWYGRTCIRLRGKDAVVVNDPYPAIVGPTGRGITGDVVTFSHPDDAPLAEEGRRRLSRDGGTAIPTSLEPAFVLDGPGEYEVHDVLLTGVRTYRDNAKGAERGRQTAFVTELDGLHTIHLGDIGHELTEEKLADIGRVDIACVPIGGALTATTAAALIAQLGPQDRRPDAGLRGGGGLRRGAQEVPPRDGRRAHGAAQAVRDARPASRPRRRPCSWSRAARPDAVTPAAWDALWRFAVPLAVAAVLAVVDWLAVWAGGPWGRRVERIAKPGVMVALIAAAWLATPVTPEARAAQPWLVAGLVASLAGDVLLLPPGRFVAGLAAFLVAHLAYLRRVPAAAGRDGVARGRPRGGTGHRCHGGPGPGASGRPGLDLVSRSVRTSSRSARWPWRRRGPAAGPPSPGRGCSSPPTRSWAGDGCASRGRASSGAAGGCAGRW